MKAMPSPNITRPSISRGTRRTSSSAGGNGSIAARYPHPHPPQPLVLGMVIGQCGPQPSPVPTGLGSARGLELDADDLSGPDPAVLAACGGHHDRAVLGAGVERAEIALDGAVERRGRSAATGDEAGAERLIAEVRSEAHTSELQSLMRTEYAALG